MSARAAPLESCGHCGLPSREPYCCGGCWVAAFVCAGRAEQGAGRASDALLARVLLCAFLTTGLMVFSLSLWAPLVQPAAPGEFEGEGARALAGLARLAALALSAPVLWLLGAPLAAAVVARRSWLSSEALVLAGVGAAWCASLWSTLRDEGHVWFETASVVLVLYALGRWLDVRARERARAGLEGLAPELLRAVTLVDQAGQEREVDPRELRAGERLRLRPGDELPVDGSVLEGRSFVDASALTGESQPASAGPGEKVLAGSRLVDGSLLVRVDAAVGARVRDAVERALADAAASRPRAVAQADRLASWLLPSALAIACLSALVRWRSAGPEEALLGALAVVLVACPCALGLATPLAFWSALGALWKRGVLVRGGAVLERLARARRVFLDKTGTLTEGELELVELRALPDARELDTERLLARAAAVELGSEHPLGRAIVRAARARGLALPAAEEFRALPGVGVEARVGGARHSLRRASSGAREEGARDEHTRVTLWRDDTPLAELALRARARPEARLVLERLRARGLELGVLTGDAEGPAQALAAELGVRVEHGLLPADKLARLAAAGRRGTVFVGDGLNDAAALAAADVGVVLAGGAAEGLAVADATLLRGGLGELPALLALARSARRTARANLAWAASWNVLGIGLAAFGLLTPIAAAAAMVLSSTAVLWLSLAAAKRLERESGRGSAPAADSGPAAAAQPSTDPGALRTRTQGSLALRALR